MVVCRMEAWPRRSPASLRWHLSLQIIPFSFERCKGVISVGSELVLTPQWGTGMAKTRLDPSVRSCGEGRGGCRLFRVCWLEISAFLDGGSVSSQTTWFVARTHSKRPMHASKRWLPTASLHGDWKYMISTRVSVSHRLCKSRWQLFTSL